MHSSARAKVSWMLEVRLTSQKHLEITISKAQPSMNYTAFFLFPIPTSPAVKT